MTFQTTWYETLLPDSMIDIMDKDLNDNYGHMMNESQVGTDRFTSKGVRDSAHAWIPTNYWISGFLWHYIGRANRENFLYDITQIDCEHIQYTRYNEGQFYGWHVDSGLHNWYKPEFVSSESDGDRNKVKKDMDMVRKLSFSLQLSDHETYDGGNLVFRDEQGKRYIAPRKRGNIIIFDSRTPHCITKVTKGTRKSIVGWAIGPRWK
mgnify:CR=1 FL=1